MNAFLLFNVVLLIISALILSFVLSWREIYMEECQKYKPHLFDKSNHPFTYLAFLKDVLSPFIMVSGIVISLGLHWVEIGDITIEYTVGFISWILYCMSQYKFIASMHHFYTQ